MNDGLKKYLPYTVLVSVCLLFFYKTITLGKIPFPGDLLLTQYAPWRHVSYGGYVAGALPSKDQYFDVLRELYPWKTLVTESLKRGTFPLWNPYNFSGSPLLANYQSQAFYPLTVLYFYLPQITAWTIMVIIQPVLGSIFMYLFATEIGLSATAAVFASLLFNFSGFANVWMEFTTVWHTILWLPLLLFVIERGIKEKRLPLDHQLLFIVGLFSSITGGHPQDFINSFLFFLVYTACRLWTASGWTIKEKLSFIFHPLSFITLMPFFLAAPQLFPTIELFRNSARVTHEYQQIIEKMLIQWWQIPLIAVQDFFGNPATKSNFTGDYVGKTLSVGVTGFFFALTAIVWQMRNWHTKFFSLVALGILVLTVRSPVSEFFYRYPLPVLSTGNPTRILFLLALALSVLAGFGYDVLWKNKKIPTKALVCTWALFILLWIFALIHPPINGLAYTASAAATMKRAMLVGTVLLGATTFTIIVSTYRKIVLLAILPICIGELFYGFMKFNPFIPKLFVFPENTLITFLQTKKGIDRFWGYGTAGVEANFATQTHIFSPDGTDPMNLKWYNQLIGSSNDGNLAVSFSRTTRSDAYLAPGYGETDLPTNEYRLRLMDVLGVRYVIDRAENPKNEKTFPQDRFKEVWHEDDWTAYENLKAAPRFFLTSDVRPYSDVSDFEKQFFSNDFQPDKTVLVETGDANRIPQLLDSLSISGLITYEPTKVEIAVRTDTPQFLFLSDTYDAGWSAFVNNKPVKLFKANFAFRGVLVPKGQSTVTFNYRPKSFETGIVISITALLLTITYFMIHTKTSSKKSKLYNSQ